MWLYVYISVIVCQFIRNTYWLTFPFQLGDAKERASGPRVAGAAGEEAALPAAAPQLPAVPHHGDQPQAARQPAARRPRARVRAAARHPGQPAQDLRYR